MVWRALVALPAHATVLTLLCRGYADLLDLVAPGARLLPSNSCHYDLLGAIISGC